jgi:hypothetical protein
MAEDVTEEALARKLAEIQEHRRAQIELELQKKKIAAELGSLSRQELSEIMKQV